MILEPINDNVVIKLTIEDSETISSGGLVISTNDNEIKPDRGTVVSVGTGRLTANGETVKLNVAKGEEVIFNRFAGTEIAYGEDKYLVLKESDILLKVK